MIRLLSYAAAGAAALSLAAAATAAQNSASIQIDKSTAISGQTLSVTFTVFGNTPVVPYEYAVENTCVYPPKTYGHFTLGQHDLIATWTDHDVNGNPMVTVPIYLQSVPAGSSCKVALMNNNVVVKGSSATYTVLAAP